ncbi:MAG: hypothetical protein K9M82_12350 [Deltaproteobacteria bacterium]|nr:hypothetical protein [Deltaproteobacteria bacterium]
MAEFGIQDEILALQLPEMLEKIGKAVDQANRGVSEFHIYKAEAEVRIAIHVKKGREVGAEFGGTLYGIGINASYQNQYGYSAEGSSLIRLKFRAKPKQDTSTPPEGETGENE